MKIELTGQEIEKLIGNLDMGDSELKAIYQKLREAKPKEQEGEEKEWEERYKDIIIVRYATSGKWVARIRKAKAKKYNSFHHYYYRSKEEREEAVNRVKANVDSRLKAKEERREAKKNFRHSLEVGDILSASWGYDQTNINYYQVKRLKGKRMVVVQEIGAVSSGETGFMSATKRAKAGAFLENEPELTRIVSEYNGVKINSCIYASPWNGKDDYYSWCH